MKSQFRALTGAVCAVLAITASGCGSSSEEPGALRSATGDATATPLAPVTSPTADDTDDTEVVDVVLDGTTVSPDGESRTVKRNQPIVLRINAASAGQLHVHSSPEKVVDYPAGNSEITLKFAIPGVVAVEDHELDMLIVQFEVN